MKESQLDNLSALLSRIAEITSNPRSVPNSLFLAQDVIGTVPPPLLPMISQLRLVTCRVELHKMSASLMIGQRAGCRCAMGKGLAKQHDCMYDVQSLGRSILYLIDGGWKYAEHAMDLWIRRESNIHTCF